MAGDRNAPSKRDLELATQRRQFAAAVASGQTGIYDRFGNRIEKDQLVLWHPPREGLVFQVVEVAPNLDPRVQPGIMNLTLTAMVPVQYAAGMRANDVLIVRAAGQVEVAVGQPTPQQPPEADEADGVDDDGVGDDAATRAPETASAPAADDQPVHDTPPADAPDPRSTHVADFVPRS